MRLKSLAKKVKKRYAKEIEFAKHEGFRAVLLSVYDDECMPYYIESYYDEDYLDEIVSECGWDTILLLDLMLNQERTIDLYEATAA